MTKKLLFILLLTAALAIPAYAVFNEKNLAQTISVLRHELHMELQERQIRYINHEKASEISEIQHKNLINTIRRINELTLILYSQEKGFTLDQTYAMEGVMDEYKKFNQRRRPQYTDLNIIEMETERYQRLIEALRLLPPKLDTLDAVPDSLRQEIADLDDKIENLNTLLDNLVVSEANRPHDGSQQEDVRQNLLMELVLSGRNSKRDAADTSENSSYILPAEAQIDRDSCIAYATAIINSYQNQKERIEEDEHYFSEMSKRLQYSYDYSLGRFSELQNYIFITGQENFLFVLSHLSRYAHDAIHDVEQKYTSGKTLQDKEELRESQWRGFMLAGTILYALFHLLLISLFVILLFNVILKKVKPFNTEWYKYAKPVVISLAIAVIYSLVIIISTLFPMSNSMIVAACLALVYLWLLIAILISLIIGSYKEDIRDGLKIFLPILAMGFMIMFIRAIFLPDKMINLILSPVLLLFLIWQIHTIRKFKNKVKEYRFANIVQYITAIVFGLALLASLFGFSLLALMFLMWWIFQLSFLATLASVAYAMSYYKTKVLEKKKELYESEHTMVSKDEDGDFIRVTWLFDLLYKAVLPIISVLSIAACIWLASSVFSLTETCRVILDTPFCDFKNAAGEPFLQVSLYNLLIVVANFFLYKYIFYLVRSLYRTWKFEKMQKESGKENIRKNDVNLTLAYNIIGLFIWGIFALYSIYILNIPIGAISIVAAGLATGVGFALKDVLNNFIYGIQLMSGRLRVGDMVECDGIRGSVEKISYQSTEIHTLSGAVISFTNSTLFNKNFQNLTKNSPYEYIKVIVSIPYGEDVNRVREFILEELNEYTKKKDKYGRLLIEKKVGIYVTIDKFAESSVDLSVNQMVLVESKSRYVAEIKERIYSLFNEKGISMPFPQREISIINMPKDPAE